MPLSWKNKDDAILRDILTEELKKGSSNSFRTLSFWEILEVQVQLPVNKTAKECRQRALQLFGENFRGRMEKKFPSITMSRDWEDDDVVPKPKPTGENFDASKVDRPPRKLLEKKIFDSENVDVIQKRTEGEVDASKVVGTPKNLTSSGHVQRKLLEREDTHSEDSDVILKGTEGKVDISRKDRTTRNLKVQSQRQSGGEHLDISDGSPEKTDFLGLGFDEEGVDLENTPWKKKAIAANRGTARGLENISGFRCLLRCLHLLTENWEVAQSIVASGVLDKMLKTIEDELSLEKMRRAERLVSLQMVKTGLADVVTHLETMKTRGEDDQEENFANITVSIKSFLNLERFWNHYSKGASAVLYAFTEAAKLRIRSCDINGQEIRRNYKRILEVLRSYKTNGSDCGLESVVRECVECVKGFVQEIYNDPEAIAQNDSYKYMVTRMSRIEHHIGIVDRHIQEIMSLEPKELDQSPYKKIVNPTKRKLKPEFMTDSEEDNVEMPVKRKRRYSSTGTRTGRFNKEEEDLLRRGVKEFGSGQWTKINMNLFEPNGYIRSSVSLKDKARTLRLGNSSNNM